MHTEERRRASHEWHVAINKYMDDRRRAGEDRAGWMYLAKEMAEEYLRLPRLFRAEREGTLPKLHQHCSHSPKEPVPDNHLTCCFGVECRGCEMLLGIERNIAGVTPEILDEIKAQTCIGHIMVEARKDGGVCLDTSEGFILTTDDRMYWDRVYSHLAAGDPADAGEPS